MNSNNENILKHSPRHALNNQPKNDKKSVLREIISWILCILTALVIALLLRTYVFEFVRVDGSSMKPTLVTDERLFVEKLTKLSSDGIKINEIVIVHYPDTGNKSYVKRVVGLPGDTIEVKHGVLIRNGVAVEENFTLDSLMDNDSPETTVPDNCYFVMGDNRNDSLDSRSVGPIDKGSIVGHAVFVIWPLWEMRMLG